MSHCVEFAENPARCKSWAARSRPLGTSRIGTGSPTEAAAPERVRQGWVLPIARVTVARINSVRREGWPGNRLETLFEHEINECDFGRIERHRIESALTWLRRGCTNGKPPGSIGSMGAGAGSPGANGTSGGSAAGNDTSGTSAKRRDPTSPGWHGYRDLRLDQWQLEQRFGMSSTATPGSASGSGVSSDRSSSILHGNRHSNTGNASGSRDTVGTGTGTGSGATSGSAGSITGGTSMAPARLRREATGS